MPPANESELRFISVDTCLPHVLDFNAADGGETAYGWLRWVNPTGEPWSELAAAMIAAYGVTVVAVHPFQAIGSARRNLVSISARKLGCIQTGRSEIGMRPTLADRGCGRPC